MVKTRTVLNRVEFGLYAQQGDDIDATRAHLLDLDPDVATDLGDPEVVTVTIEPGDKLNA